jgi:hypothetical protein
MHELINSELNGIRSGLIESRHKLTGAAFNKLRLSELLISSIKASNSLFKRIYSKINKRVFIQPTLFV